MCWGLLLLIDVNEPQCVGGFECAIKTIANWTYLNFQTSTCFCCALVFSHKFSILSEGCYGAIMLLLLRCISVLPPVSIGLLVLALATLDDIIICKSQFPFNLYTRFPSFNELAIEAQLIDFTWILMCWVPCILRCRHPSQIGNIIISFVFIDMIHLR